MNEKLNMAHATEVALVEQELSNLKAAVTGFLELLAEVLPDDPDELCEEGGGCGLCEGCMLYEQVWDEWQEIGEMVGYTEPLESDEGEAAPEPRKNVSAADGDGGEE